MYKNTVMVYQYDDEFEIEEDVKFNQNDISCTGKSDERLGTDKNGY